MNGDTTWTLCTETDGDRFVSDLLAPSSAEAILSCQATNLLDSTVYA